MKVEIFQRKVVENNVLKMRNLAISSQTVFYFEANDDVVFDLDDESPISYKNGLIWSVNFKMFFSCLQISQKTNEFFFRISALAFKKRSNQKNKGTLYQ